MPTPDTFVQLPPDSTGKQLACFTFAGGLLGHAQVIVDNAGNVLGIAASPLRIDPTGATIQPVSGNVAVSNFPASQPVTGAFFQATQPVSAAALPLPAGASTEATLAAIKAKTDNLDVALSTRTKPADAQHAIVDSGSITANAGANLNTSALALEAGGNLATIAGRDFSTSAKQDEHKARFGDNVETPDPYSVLGRLRALDATIKAQGKTPLATEATMQRLIDKLAPPPKRNGGTLLHRS